MANKWTVWGLLLVLATLPSCSFLRQLAQSRSSSTPAGAGHSHADVQHLSLEERAPELLYYLGQQPVPDELIPMPWQGQDPEYIKAKLNQLLDQGDELWTSRSWEGTEGEEAKGIFATARLVALHYDQQLEATRALEAILSSNVHSPDTDVFLALLNQYDTEANELGGIWPSYGVLLRGQQYSELGIGELVADSYAKAAYGFLANDRPLLAGEWLKWAAENTRRQLADLERAEELYETSIDALKLGGEGPAIQAEIMKAHREIANLRRSRGDLSGAVKALAAASSIATELAAVKVQFNIEMDLTQIELQQGNTDQARVHLVKAMHHNFNLQDDADPTISLLEFARLRMKCGDRQMALELYAQCVNESIRVDSPYNGNWTKPDIVAGDLARAYLLANQPYEAIQVLKNPPSSISGKETGVLRMHLDELAEALLADHQPARALEELAKLRAAIESGAPYLDSCRMEQLTGRAHWQLGEPSLALSHYQAALAEAEGIRQDRLLELLMEAGEAALDVDTDEAIAVYEQAFIELAELFIGLPLNSDTYGVWPEQLKECARALAVAYRQDGQAEPAQELADVELQVDAIVSFLRKRPDSQELITYRQQGTYWRYLARILAGPRDQTGLTHKLAGKHGVPDELQRQAMASADVRYDMIAERKLQLEAAYLVATSEVDIVCPELASLRELSSSFPH